MNYDEYLQSRLMESRHDFIYAEQKQERQKFLKEMVSNYPVVLISLSPIGVYIDDKGLPKVTDITDKSKDMDYITLSSFHSSYYGFLIISSIMETLSNQLSQDILNNPLLLRYFDRQRNEDFPSFKTFSDVLEALKQGQEHFYLNYIKYAESGKCSSDFLTEVPLSFIISEMSIQAVKRYLNIDSYFALVFDIQNELSPISQQAINSYIGSRCNADMAIKIACSKDDWCIYRDLNGNYIENIHDYGDFDINDYLKKRVLK